MPELMKTKEIVNPGSIVIATSTLYPDWFPTSSSDSSVIIRGNLALETIRSGISSGYKFVLVDGGSSQVFIDEAKNLGAHVLAQTEKGMSPGRRQAFTEASKFPGSKVICWLEPEKVSVIKDCLPAAILPILTGEADVVVPKRDEASFLTYPDYQVKWEKRANNLWNKILKKRGLMPQESEDLDVWFGPKFFRNDPAILDIFLTKYQLAKSGPKLNLYKAVNPEDWANSTFLPIITALKEGYKVKSVIVPYRHPPEQTKLEQNSDSFLKKRVLQFESIIFSTIELIKFLENNPKSLIMEG